MADSWIFTSSDSLRRAESILSLFFIERGRVYLVIGEATKNIPEEIRQNKPHIEWRKMAGMRDMMIHGSFSINYRIIWDVVQNKIPTLKQQVEQLLKEMS